MWLDILAYLILFEAVTLIITLAVAEGTSSFMEDWKVGHIISLGSALLLGSVAAVTWAFQRLLQ